jgi:HEAT repeat protein
MPALRSLLFLALLGTALAGQDLHAARRGFAEALRRNQGLEAAITALVATADPRGLDDFLEALARDDQELARLRAKIEAKGKETREIWKNIDEQGSKGRSVSAGSVTGIERKHEELQRELVQLGDQEEAIEARMAALARGAARLLDGLPAEGRTSQLLGIATRIDRSRKLEEQLLLLSVLAASGSAEAFDALAGVLATSPRPELRTAAADALAAHRSPRAWALLGKALEDEAFTVQLAALAGLSRAHDLAAVPAILKVLERSSGRLSEEAQAALEDLTGQAFHDNATLWRNHYESTKEADQGTLADLAGESTARRIAAVVTVGRKGPLAAVRQLVRGLGLGPRGPADAEPALSAAGDPEAAAARDAVRAALSRAPEASRERLLHDLFFAPFRSEKDMGRRAAYLETFGGVRDESVRVLLGRFAGSEILRNPHTREAYAEADRRRLRLAAVRGLAAQGVPEVVGILREPLGGSTDPEIRLAALHGISIVRHAAAVEPLVRALADKDSRVSEGALAALRDLTGEDKGTDYAAWREWWNKAQKGFVARGAAAEAVAKPKPPTGFYGIESRSKHVVYILDRSGSMNATDTGTPGQTRMDAAREELIRAVTGLPDGATFNIIFYNHAYELWRKGMVQATKENRAAAVAWIRSITAVGATNIFDPLEKAFELAGRGTSDAAYGIELDTIFFMSDGQPNRGRIVQPAHIVREVRRMNRLKKVKIHTIGIGEGQDGDFMEALAALSGGQYVKR